MSVKKLTIMILDEANKGRRGVFDADGVCVQGDDSVRTVALEVLDVEASVPTAPVAPQSPTPATPQPQADEPMMPEPLSSTDVPAK